MSKLLSQGSFGCTFYPGIRCKDKPMYNYKTITKIQVKDKISTNEAYIGSIIRDIPSYTLFFLPVINECPVNLRKISQKEISKCKIIKNYKNKYVAMEVPYVKEIKFVDIIKTKTAKYIILTVIETYKYLLMALDKLQQAQIVHFDLKLDNILFHGKTFDPRIIDFGISIPVKNVTTSNLENYFYSYAPEYYVWCLDIHIICFLTQETNHTLTKEEAETIATLYVGNHRALEFFPKEFTRQYLDLCIAQVKRYVGKPKEDLIKELIRYSNTWDNYSLSVMYLQMLTLLFPEDHSENKFILLFGEILLKNIHPDPLQRLSLKESEKQFSEIFYMDITMDSYLNIATRLEEEKPSVTAHLGSA